MTTVRRLLPAFALATAFAAAPAAPQAIGDWNAFEHPPPTNPPASLTKAKCSVLTVNGKPVALDGVLPPAATKAMLVGPGGTTFEIVKVGLGQWQTTGGPLPGLYHYRVVTVDETGAAGPKSAPGALHDLPGVPQAVSPGPPDKAKRVMQSPGPPDSAAGPSLGGRDTKSPGGPDTKPGSLRGHEKSHRLAR